MTPEDLWTTQYLSDQVRPLIDKHGWMVQGVFAESAGFCYTVGLTGAGLPELVISGLPMQKAGSILNAAARRHCAAEITPGATLTDVSSVPVRAVAAPSAQVSVARALYGRDKVRAVQLVWPDAAGAYPGEAGWSLGDRQPLYTSAAGEPHQAT